MQDLDDVEAQRVGLTSAGAFVVVTVRDSGYGMVLPDTITIFQEPLEQAFRDDAELVEEVRVTVLHELAPFFGMSDEDLHRLGLT